MKREDLYIVLFIVMCFRGYTQSTFQKIISLQGNQKAVAVTQAATNDFYVLCETDSGQSNSKDFLLVKMNMYGTVLWSRHFGTTANDIPGDVKELSTGHIVMCGYTYSNGLSNPDIILIKADSAGNVLWTKTYGGAQADYAYKMVATSGDSSVVVAGQTSSFGVVPISGYVLKISSNGSITWSLTSNVNNFDCMFNCIDKTFDGNYIVSGIKLSGAQSGYVIKLSDFGTVLSNISPYGPSTYLFYGCKSIPGGDVLFTGQEKDASDTSSVFIMRSNPSSFSVSFVKKYFSGGSEKGKVALITPDGNLAVIGNNFDQGISNGFYCKFGLTGNILYTVNYCPGTTHTASDLSCAIVCNDNTIFMAGSVWDTTTMASEIYIVKIQHSALSGCNELPVNFSQAFLFQSTAIGSNNNFGGISNAINATSTLQTYWDNTMCFMSGLNENTAEKKHHMVFPNPVETELSIESDFANYSVIVLNSLGQTIMSAYNSPTSLQLMLLEKGVYFIKLIELDTGKQTHVKFTKL